MSLPTSPNPAGGVAWSWSAPQGPAVHGGEVPPLAVRLYDGVGQGVLPSLQTMRLLPDDEPSVPSVSTLPLDRVRLATFTYSFVPPDAPAAAWRKPALDAQALPPLPALGADGARPSRTALRAPDDLVKLQDRLYYVLQPPVEFWMTAHALDMPYQPFPYQFEGIAFLYPRSAAILADEMGLGKTMQAITAIRLLLHAGEANRVLMVCPKPLVDNWQHEFARWAPEIPLMIIEGDQTKRRWQWETTDAPVKIANYELLNRDREIFEQPEIEFDLVALDESQRIKNRLSSTAQVVRSIRRRRSWALTGTPVENSADDLVGIFEFLAPGYLSVDMKLNKMSRVAGQFVLRRTKDQVLTELPPKMFRDADIELGSEQRASYKLAEEDGVLRLTEMGEAATIQHVFELVLRLKQICNFDPATGESAKLERLAADLEEVQESGRKAIVFSQWVDTLEELGRRLGQFSPLMYHGRVHPRERPAVLERFRQDPNCSVLLMSYGTGSVGLNLQFAGYVFLFDRWWNPAVEDQAINRAHRIGAAGPVTVTRFLSQNTIEERINQVLQDKREIFDTLFSDHQPTGRLGLSRSEIFGLFQLRTPSGPIQVPTSAPADAA